MKPPKTEEDREKDIVRSMGFIKKCIVKNCNSQVRGYAFDVCWYHYNMRKLV